MLKKERVNGWGGASAGPGDASAGCGEAAVPGAKERWPAKAEVVRSKRVGSAKLAPKVGQSSERRPKSGSSPCSLGRYFSGRRKLRAIERAVHHVSILFFTQVLIWFAWKAQGVQSAASLGQYIGVDGRESSKCWESGITMVPLCMNEA